MVRDPDRLDRTEDRVRRAVTAAAVAGHEDGASRLGDLCDAATADLGLRSSTVSMMTELGPMVLATSRGGGGSELADLQVACGVGPAFSAAGDHRPVLANDLTASGRARWGEFAARAVDLGCRASWTFPLGVGAVRFGVMEMSHSTVQTMQAERTRAAMTFAEIATEILLDIEGGRADVERDLGVARVVGLRAEVYQAQGMVMVDLDVPATDALVRMRAHAFVHDLDLAELSRGLVARTVRLENDHDPSP